MDAARRSSHAAGTPPAHAGDPDLESQRWLDALSGDGPQRAAALSDLYALLLGAARFEISRRRAMMSHLRGGDFDDIAHQSADDALVAVVRKLGDFRGESRFTTWAYKFALYEAAAKLRLRAWQARELPTEPAHWPDADPAQASPQKGAEQAELLEAVRKAIDEVLSGHQREVLVALALNGIPIDVLAERLHTSRGALYKTLHDARKKLRRRLAEQGLGDTTAEGQELG